MSNKLWQSMKTHFIPNLVFTWNLNSGVLWHQDLTRHNNQFSNCNPILGRSRNGAFYHQLHCHRPHSLNVTYFPGAPWTWPTWLHRKIKLVVIRFILCIHIFENFHSAAQCAAAFECPASCAQWDMVGPPVWQTGHSRRQVLWISGWADDVGITLQIQPKNY